MLSKVMLTKSSLFNCSTLSISFFSKSVSSSRSIIQKSTPLLRLTAILNLWFSTISVKNKLTAVYTIIHREFTNSCTDFFKSESTLMVSVVWFDMKYYYRIKALLLYSYCNYKSSIRHSYKIRINSSVIVIPIFGIRSNLTAIVQAFDGYLAPTLSRYSIWNNG